MKRLIFAGGLSLVLAVAAPGAPLNVYTNYGFITDWTLVIDSTNVVNLGIFDITVPASIGPFGFSDMLNFTNRNVMLDTQGFIFDHAPTTPGNIGPSTSFANQNPGQIYGGAVALQTGLITNASGGTAPQIIINATNITSSGILQVGQTGRIAATGSALNLSHGSTIIEGFETPGGPAGGAALGPGEFLQFWGGGYLTNLFFYSDLSLNTTILVPSSPVVNNDHSQGFESHFLTGASAIAITNIINASNIYTQAVIYLDSGPNNDGFPEVAISAYFLPPVITPISTNNFRTAVVKWSAQAPDAFGNTVTNNLYLTDDLGSLPTNLTFVTNNVTLGGLTQLVPTNYTIRTAFNDASLTNFGNTPYNQKLFTNGFGTNGDGSGEITNLFAIFQVNLAPVTVQPDPLVAGSTFSNVPARVEITANKSLDLTGATLDAGNFLNLSSTNHYMGSQGAQITFPFADINLGSTNGQMTISNLASPYLVRFNGPIFAWTAAWTNITSAIGGGTNTNTFAVTNAFMVTIVGSQLSPTSPVNIENLSLRSTNLVISDILNVDGNMLINAQNLTITSNTSEDLTPAGQLLFSPPQESDLYSAFLPGMQNLTNSGSLETVNAAFYQTRQDPNGPSAGDGPWQSVVNHGTMLSGGGITIWANNFGNTGPFTFSPATIEVDGFGAVDVTATTALLTNSSLIAIDGDMVLASGSFTFANATNSATGLLGLSASTLLTDLAPSDLTAVGRSNFWSVGDGFSLNAAPSNPSELLDTSITSSCRNNVQCENFWAGVPVGLSAAGFTNVLPAMAGNAPLGRLILNGGNNKSTYHFEGANYDTVNPYAIYVDQLQLLNGATNKSGTNYTAFKIDPNVTIYYLDATATVGTNTGDISAALSGQAGGHLVWVSNYVGRFSYVSHTYPDTRTFLFNRAYVMAFGIPPEPPGPPPPLTPQSIALAIAATNVSSHTMADISWYAPAYSTNTLYYRTMLNTNWIVRTNIVQGAVSSRLDFVDSMATNRLYRVGVTPAP